MIETTNIQNENEQELRRMARKRVTFKRGLLGYIIINLMLVGIWFFGDRGSFFWPIWCILGWGTGIAFHYLKVYHGPSATATEKEYQKLRKKMDPNV